jgi:site-specific DNA recombinase
MNVLPFPMAVPTGFMVWNRHDGKARPRDGSEWIWSNEPAHEALISRELFEQAASFGQVVEGSRAGNEPNPHPMTRRTYLLRSYVHCAICGRE